jgi:hypothetical protein
MAYAPSAAAPHELNFTRTRAPVRTGFWRRLHAAVLAARLRQAEREIARYLVDSGGKFTDETEREIERRFLSSRSQW